MSLESRAKSRVEDPGAELLDRATSLWDQHSRTILAAAAVVVTVVAVSVFVSRSGSAREEQATSKLAEANIMFWQGDYTRSLQIAKQVSEQYANTPSGLDALRLAGDNAFWSADFKGAADYYKRYLAKSSSGPIADGVRRSSAYALESDAQYQAAATAYESVVGKYDRESSAEFLAGAARCYAALKQPAEAAKRLQRLVDEFGETSYAQVARIHLAELTGAKP